MPCQSRQLLFGAACVLGALGCLVATGPVVAQQPPEQQASVQSLPGQPPPDQAPPGLPTGPPAAGPAGSAPAAGVPVGDQVMAWVSDQPIFASEIFARVDSVMAENKERIPKEQWDQQRLTFAAQALKAGIESKLVLADALHKIPASVLPELEKKINEQFESEHIKKLMESTKTDSRTALEAKLLASGSSLEQQRRTYYERSLGMQWVRQMVKSDKEVGHNDMVAYYEAHLTDYDHTARARWEELSVDTDHFPSKGAAYAVIARMGNDVMRGVPFADVARAGSQGLTAAQGGQRDWTTQGSLASQVLDKALFTLPVGTFSPILEEPGTFRIVRVVERQDAYRTPFRDAQIKIHDEIDKLNREKAVEEYYVKLRADTRVWTVFDDPASAERFAKSLPSTRPQ